MSRTTAIRHTSFCVGQDGHDMGNEECSGPVVELTPGLFGYLQEADKDGAVVLELSGAVGVTATQIDEIVTALGALQSQLLAVGDVRTAADREG